MISKTFFTALLALIMLALLVSLREKARRKNSRAGSKA